jgi:hypothetical protein
MDPIVRVHLVYNDALEKPPIYWPLYKSSPVTRRYMRVIARHAPDSSALDRAQISRCATTLAALLLFGPGCSWQGLAIGVHGLLCARNGDVLYSFVKRMDHILLCGVFLCSALPLILSIQIPLTRTKPLTAHCGCRSSKYQLRR